MRTPVREAFSYGIRHNHCDSWPYASLNHNEYAISRAISRMKMPPVREYASSHYLATHWTVQFFCNQQKDAFLHPNMFSQRFGSCSSLEILWIEPCFLWEITHVDFCNGKELICERNYRKMGKDRGNISILPTRKWEVGFGPGIFLYKAVTSALQLSNPPPAGGPPLQGPFSRLILVYTLAVFVRPHWTMGVIWGETGGHVPLTFEGWGNTISNVPPPCFLNLCVCPPKSPISL